MFPSNVRDRLFPETTRNRENPRDRGNKSRLKNFLVEGEEQNFLQKSKPIADLFPETSILFADVAGFTAWSSTREPCQVSDFKQIGIAKNQQRCLYPVVNCTGLHLS
jgi:class 3 adenylate cyclase